MVTAGLFSCRQGSKQRQITLIDVYKLVLTESWYSQTAPLLNDRKDLLAQVAQVEDKIAYIEELVSSKQLALPIFGT